MKSASFSGWREPMIPTFTCMWRTICLVAADALVRRPRKARLSPRRADEGVRPHDDFSGFHDEHHMFQRVDVFERIAIHRDQIGRVSLRDFAYLIADSEPLGGERRRG